MDLLAGDMRCGKNRARTDSLICWDIDERCDWIFGDELALNEESCVKKPVAQEFEETGRVCKKVDLLARCGVRNVSWVHTYAKLFPDPLIHAWAVARTGYNAESDCVQFGDDRQEDFFVDFLVEFDIDGLLPIVKETLGHYHLWSKMFHFYSTFCENDLNIDENVCWPRWPPKEYRWSKNGLTGEKHYIQD